MSSSTQDRKSNSERDPSRSYESLNSMPPLAQTDSATVPMPRVQGNQPSPSTRSECSDEESTTQSPNYQHSGSGNLQLPSQETRIAGPGRSPNNLHGLLCNDYRTTGQEPPALVGASTTIVGDSLFVFGGRRLRPQRLTSSLFVLDLISRHWKKLETTGDRPSPRFFHSMCALGDTKLVCYGGMALVQEAITSSSESPQKDMKMTVTSDIHVYDIATQAWTFISTSESPARRYAHCATILPSSAVFSSPSAPVSALRHNPPSETPNQGTLGVSIDGRGAAEMIIVGGQDGQSKFINTIEVFNFRSLTWSQPPVDLKEHYGAYRSVVAPLTGFPASRIGRQVSGAPQSKDEDDADERTDITEHVSGSPMLVFSNWNFTNTIVDVMIRHPDGTLIDKSPQRKHKPPGLRFPTGGIIDKYLIISGTYITSQQQGYMIWALDLEKLVWSRIDPGDDSFVAGSWNRGLLWSKRNIYVILGNRKRSLGEDYNTRRLNFTNVCTVELEAFGLYDNPTRDISTGLQSLDSQMLETGSSDANRTRPPQHSAILDPVETLGFAAMGAMELCDMEIESRDGERVPVSSHILRVRWGAYFQQLLREGLAKTQGASDSETLHSSHSADTRRNRSSIATVTPSTTSTLMSNGTTAVDSDVASQQQRRRQSYASTANSQRRESVVSTATTVQTARKDSVSGMHSHYIHPRLLYLPHTLSTIRALVHYLYTTKLPPPDSSLCTPQILCSLLQLARPYHVPGLLEATIERLHHALDRSCTAAVFNAAAMAAGGGGSVRFTGGMGDLSQLARGGGKGAATHRPAPSQHTVIEDDSEDALSSASASTASMSDIEEAEARNIWTGDISAVVGLQKRGLRGLMEGRLLREQRKGDETIRPAAARSAGAAGASGYDGLQNAAGASGTSLERVGGNSFGLGIG